MKTTLRFKEWTLFPILACASVFSVQLFAADTVMHNAFVYTVNEEQPTASAVAIENGKIVFVGGEDGIEPYIHSSTRVLDLDGQMLLPGFIDTHNHVFEGASGVGGGCELSRDRRLDRQTRFLQACQRSISGPGEWVIGYGHQLDTLLQNRPSANPRKILDEYFPDNPIIIMEESSHSMLANSKALALAGFDKNAENPQGGTLLFGKDNRPNGILFDNAGDIVMELAWNSLSDTFQASYDGLIAGMEAAVSNGITTIGDGRLYWKRGWYDVWQKALKDDEVIVRTSLRPWIYPDVDFDEQLAYLKTIQSSDENDLLIVDQVKLYIDGVLHFGTAKVLAPYHASWQKNLPYGLNYIEPDALPQLLSDLNTIGYGAHVHAIGDQGVRETLDAVETARAAGAAETIYSMTHLELVDPSDYGRFAQLGVHADFQAGAAFFDNTNWARFYVGREKAKRMMPMRKLYDTGANVTFSSDWTVNPLNPLVAIANSLRLRESKGLPDIHEAIRAATINGAYALGLESVTGSIEIGKSADFVVLDRSILDADSDQVEDAVVEMTMLQGELVFDGTQ
ncbi:MAG: amidohydrolase [Pseudomonadota bacterium]